MVVTNLCHVIIERPTCVTLQLPASLHVGSNFSPKYQPHDLAGPERRLGSQRGLRFRGPEQHSDGRPRRGGCDVKTQRRREDHYGKYVRTSVWTVRLCAGLTFPLAESSENGIHVRVCPLTWPRCAGARCISVSAPTKAGPAVARRGLQLVLGPIPEHPGCREELTACARLDEVSNSLAQCSASCDSGDIHPTLIVRRSE